jgi:hypothetical protein
VQKRILCGAGDEKRTRLLNGGDGRQLSSSKAKWPSWNVDSSVIIRGSRGGCHKFVVFSNLQTLTEIASLDAAIAAMLKQAKYQFVPNSSVILRFATGFTSKVKDCRCTFRE